MQPDLPEPVVPAIRMCGIRARSAHTDGAGDVLAEPDRQRARRLRQVVEDVAERDEVRAQVRDLDADRLLAGDRREDADLGGRERVREVVLQLRDLPDLRARRELELVAGHARAGDLADHGRLDAEMRQAGDERLGDALAGFAVRAGARLRDAEQRRVGQLVVGVDALGRVEQRLLRVLLGVRSRRARRARAGAASAAAPRRSRRPGPDSRA